MDTSHLFSLLTRTLKESFSDSCRETLVEFLEWKPKKVWRPPVTRAPGVSHSHACLHWSSSNLLNILVLIVTCVTLCSYPVVWSNIVWVLLWWNFLMWLTFKSVYHVSKPYPINWRSMRKDKFPWKGMDSVSRLLLYSRVQHLLLPEFSACQFWTCQLTQ